MNFETFGIIHGMKYGSPAEGSRLIASKYKRASWSLGLFGLVSITSSFIEDSAVFVIIYDLL